MAVLVLRLYLLLLICNLHVNGQSVSMTDDDSVEIITLNESQYCFVNQNTIRVSDNFTSELQDIVNKTENVIISTTINSTVIFIAPLNGTRCSSEDDSTTSTLIFIIQIIIYSVTILVAMCNIMLHLMIKELRTIPGLLITTMCSSVIAVTVVAAGNLIYANSVEDESTLVCVLVVNIVFYLLFAYQSIKLSILFHFAYLMYKNYRLMSQETVNKRCVFIKYIIFVMITSTLSLLVAILVDLPVSGMVYSERRSFCINTEVAIQDTPIFSIVATAILAVFIIFEITVFSIGLTFYFLVTKSCCSTKSTNLRVAVTLAATIGIAIVILLSLNAVTLPSNVFVLSITSGTAVEQMILLTLLLTSKKVRANFPCMRTRAGTSDPELRTHRQQASFETQQTSLETISSV